MAKLTGTNPDQVPTNADLGTMAYQDKDNVNVGSFTSNGIDDNATSTAMTLDSSGNLLVGKTSAGIGTSGVELKDGNEVSTLNVTTTRGTANVGQVALFNRLTSDGTIIDLRKDGTTVGSIGVTGSGTQPYFVKASTGGFKIGNDGSTALLLPVNADGSNSDGGAQLGDATKRFKDLYLSGGVVFGDAGGSGTSSSNTLDSYEEGRWTPSITASSVNPTVGYDAQRGLYTKVGRLVTLHFYMDTNSRSGGSGDLRVSGIPFAISDNNEALGASQAEYKGITMPSDANNIFIRVNPSATYLNLEFMDTRAGVSAALRGNIPIGNVGGDSRILATVTYLTDA